MNKANVFLLVVVSSLLTYISTANQPAAASVAAQEKWEYGVSMGSDLNNSAISSFQFTSLGLSKEVLLYENEVVFIEGTTIRWSKNFDSNGLQGLAYANKCNEILLNLGREGWHPFQVDVDSRILPHQNARFTENFINRRVYWRRRVQ